jgi:hypothetical protein
VLLASHTAILPPFRARVQLKVAVAIPGATATVFRGG